MKVELLDYLLIFLVVVFVGTYHKWGLGGVRPQLMAKIQPLFVLLPISQKAKKN